MSRKVYIKTFGCQMNEYDSDKMADVLGAAQGYEKTDDPEQADLILFNTCSVREKAQEKVFHDLGRVKHLKQSKPALVIGVGGAADTGGGGSGAGAGPAVSARPARYRRAFARATTRSSDLNGLGMCVFMPAARHLAASSLNALAVSATIGTLRSAPRSARIALVAEMPSISGI